MSQQSTTKKVLIALLLTGSSLFAGYTNGLFDEIMEMTSDKGKEKEHKTASIPSQPISPAPSSSKPKRSVTPEASASSAALEKEVSSVIQSPWRRDPFYLAPITRGMVKDEIQARHVSLSNDPPMSDQATPQTMKQNDDEAWQAITVYQWPDGEWFDDETEEDPEEKKVSQVITETTVVKESDEPPSLILKMVFFNGKQWTAVVDEGSTLVTVRKGDRLGKQQVIQVTKNGVMLQSETWGEQRLAFVNKTPNLRLSVAINKR